MVRVTIGSDNKSSGGGSSKKEDVPRCPEGQVWDPNTKTCVPIIDRKTARAGPEKKAQFQEDEQRIQNKNRQADLERLRLLREQGLAGGVETPEQTAFIEEQQLQRGARVQGVETIQEKRAGEQRLAEIEQLGVESGAFEQVQQVPLINPELQGDPLAVTKDIFLADVVPLAKRFTIGSAISNDLNDIANFLKKPARNDVEAAMQEQAIISSNKDVSKSLIDKELESQEKVLIQNGIPLSVGASVAGGIAGATIVTPITDPISQSIGSDEKIANLASALEKYDELITLPSRAMDESGLTAEEALARIDRMESAVDALEMQLQKDAINSADVRVSLRNAGIEVQIFKLRQKANDQKRSILIKGSERALGETDISKGLSFVQELSRKYGK